MHFEKFNFGGPFNVFTKEPYMLKAMTAKEEMQDNRYLPSVYASLAASFENRGLACYQLHAWCVGAAQTLKRKCGNLGLTKLAPRCFRS